MDYEKKYKEAIEKFDVLLNLNTVKESGTIFVDDVRKIFPELKESKGDKDKRIRKNLIKALEICKWCGDKYWSSDLISIDDAIAWLEKQGEQRPDWSKEDGGAINVVLRLLRKQLSENKNPSTSECYVRAIKILKSLISQKPKDGIKKPTNNIESKLEIGDLITNGILVGKIDKIHEWGYHAYFGDHYADVPDIENWHKWTIKDAKPGDILFTSSTASHEIFIFKSIDEKGNAKCYFAYDSEDGFREGKYHFIGKASKCKPATKEQRVLLFQKMKEAGYKWDSDKLKLEKVEPITYMFKYYLNGNSNNMPTEFLVNWELSILENHLYILEKTLEEDDIQGYLKYVWQGYYGKEVYIDVYEKNVIKGSGPYYDVLLFRFKVEGGKVLMMRKK